MSKIKNKTTKRQIIEDKCCTKVKVKKEMKKDWQLNLNKVCPKQDFKRKQQIIGDKCGERVKAKNVKMETYF